MAFLNPIANSFQQNKDWNNKNEGGKTYKKK